MMKKKYCEKEVAAVDKFITYLSIEHKKEIVKIKNQIICNKGLANLLLKWMTVCEDLETRKDILTMCGCVELFNSDLNTHIFSDMTILLYDLCLGVVRIGGTKVEENEKDIAAIKLFAKTLPSESQIKIELAMSKILSNTFICVSFQAWKSGREKLDFAFASLVKGDPSIYNSVHVQQTKREHAMLTAELTKYCTEL